MPATRRSDMPDGEGGFRAVLTAGMSDELIASLGPCPAHTECSGRCSNRVPFRIPDIHDDPRFRGWWPRGHPEMRSFLGVPIVPQAGVIGSFYLTEKEERSHLPPPTRS